MKIKVKILKITHTPCQFTHVFSCLNVDAYGLNCVQAVVVHSFHDCD